MRILNVFFCLIILVNFANAEDSVLTDKTGDGKIIINAFGDSITYGVGDGVEPNEKVDQIPTTDGTKGYPARIQQYLNVPVDNEGRPGEQLAVDGIYRFPSSVIGTSADIVLLFEGANDAFSALQASDYELIVQKAINAARALGRLPVLVTLPVFCCSSQQLPPFTNRYSDVLRKLASINDIPYADVQRAWINGCPIQATCDLLNLPEGLHPNRKGYDVIAQTISAALLGIDIFASDGPQNLANAIGVDLSLIQVTPDSATTEASS